MGNSVSAKIERRVAGSLEVRDAGGDAKKPMITGYAAKFNSLSLPLGFDQFREKIDPVAFDECLAMGSTLDCRFCFNHDANFVMGRTTAGTLRLSRDATGLRFECDPPDTQQARDLMESIKRGDVSQCSFAFRTLDDDWSEDNDGNLMRTLKKVTIHNGDVSAVTYPAYPDTDVSMRAAVDAVGLEGRQRLHRGAKNPYATDGRDAKKPYGDVDYADPGYQDDGVHRYPLDSVEHIKAAWDYIHKSNDAAKYTADQVSKIKAKIVAAWKEKIDKDGPPEAESKSADDAARAASERDRDLELAEVE